MLINITNNTMEVIMKHSIITFSIILLSLISFCFAQEADKSTFSAQDPVLLTSAGQSADILMLKILAKKASLDFTLDKTATPEKVEKFKSLIVVCGGSTKGLGAAKIDKEEEYARAEKIMDNAKKNKIPVIVAHLGGKSRRGALSDYFNKLAANKADHLIVVKGGDQDGFFSNIAKENKVSIDLTEKIVLIKELLKKIYAKE